MPTLASYDPHKRMKRMLSIEMIEALLLEIDFYTSNDEDIARVLGQVLVEGQVNTNALTNLEELLIQKQMRNVLQLMRQTLRGNFKSLPEFRAVLERFHNENNPTTSGRTTKWPPWCYRFSRGNDPIVQELKKNEAKKDNQPSENSDQPIARLPGNHESGSFRSPQVPPLEPELPLPYGPLSSEQLIQPQHCCTCRENIQNVGTSSLWTTDVFERLTTEQRQRFVAEVNEYDPDILASIESQFFASTVTADAFIITLLRQRHLSGRKCLFCLLHDVFENIGRSDLALQIRAIRHRKS